MKANTTPLPLRLAHRCLFLLGLLASWGHPCVLRAQAKLPNIVILLADDLGYGELGCQGNKEIPTPHIDSLASNGIRFTDGYVTAAYCSACLLYTSDAADE